MRLAGERVREVATLRGDDKKLESLAVNRPLDLAVDMVVSKAVSDHHEMCVGLQQAPPKLLHIASKYSVTLNLPGLVASHDQQTLTFAAPPIGGAVQLDVGLAARCERVVAIGQRLPLRTGAGLMVQGLIHRETTHSRELHRIPAPRRDQRDIEVIDVMMLEEQSCLE